MMRALIVTVAVLSAGCVQMERPIPVTSHDTRAADYPADSIRLHEQGATRLRYRIDTDGNVKEVEILDSSGYPRLDEASAEMIKKEMAVLACAQERQVG
jgi:TonB family protein